MKGVMFFVLASLLDIPSSSAARVTTSVELVAAIQNGKEGATIEFAPGTSRSRRHSSRILG